MENSGPCPFRFQGLGFRDEDRQVAGRDRARRRCPSDFAGYSEHSSCADPAEATGYSAEQYGHAYDVEQYAHHGDDHSS